MSWSITTQGSHDAARQKVEADQYVPTEVKQATAMLLSTFDASKDVQLSSHGHVDQRDWSIKNEDVLIRDRWTCQLCGLLAPKSLKGTQHPLAPEVDHIVPLSTPGSPGHVWSNVQCAHRKCNGAKGSRPIGQLRLM